MHDPDNLGDIQTEVLEVVTELSIVVSQLRLLEMRDAGTIVVRWRCSEKKTRNFFRVMYCSHPTDVLQLCAHI